MRGRLLVADGEFETDTPIAGGRVQLLRDVRDPAASALPDHHGCVCTMDRCFDELAPTLSEEVVAESRTDDCGRYELAVPLGGDHVVRAEAEGRAPFAVRIDPTAKGDLPLWLCEPVTSVLRVEDGGTGSPLASAEVLVFDGGRVPVARFATGPDGWVHVRTSERGRFLIRVPGRAPEMALRGHRFDEAPEIVVPVFPAGPLAGTVVDSTGAPVAGAAVALHHACGWIEKRITGADGAFRYDAVAPDDRVDAGRLYASRAGWTRTDVAVEPGRTDVRLVIDQFATVAGRVRSEVVLRAPSIRLESMRPGHFPWFVSCNPTFRIEDVPPGKVLLRATVLSDRNPELVIEARREIDVAPGSEVRDLDIVLAEPRGGSFARVVLESADYAWQDIEVEARVGGTIVSRGDRRVGTPWLLHVDGPPGTEVLVAASRAYGGEIVLRGSGVVRTAASTDLEPVVITVLGPPRLTVRVTDPLGAPVPESDTTIHVTPHVGEPDLTGRPIPWNRTVTVVATHARFAPGIAEVEPASSPDREVIVRLRRPARLTGRVVHRDGHPASAGVRAIALEPAMSSFVEFFSTTGSEGEFVLEGVPPGRFRVEPHGESFEVVEGVDRDLGTLTLPEPRPAPKHPRPWSRR